MKGRNPALFENCLAPPEELINLEFYHRALSVLCQTSFHADIVKKNTHLNNILSLGGNLWSDVSLNKMEECLGKNKREGYSVLHSQIPHKGTLRAVRYCELKGLPYELIASSDHCDFLEKLSNNKYFIFFPQTPETLSRVVCEARMMGVNVITNDLVGATKEEWFSLKGGPLIQFMKEKREEIVDVVVRIFSE